LFGYGPPDGSRPPLHGGQAQRVRVPLANTTLMPVPTGVTDETAVLLTDNFPTAVAAVQRADVAAGDSVAVVGLGTVGLCAVAAAYGAGAAGVLAVDPVADRRRRAGGLGATPVSPDEVAAAHEGYRCVIEAAGTPAAQRLAFDLLRPGGVLSVIAVQTTQAFGFSPVEAYDANLTLRVGRAPVRSLLDALVDDVAAGRLEVPTSTVVTHPGTPLEEGPALYARFAAREPGLVKAVFAPGAG
jgi:threonine dehydrogenase-like Zn-dependent dehydrogenase